MKRAVKNWVSVLGLFLMAGWTLADAVNTKKASATEKDGVDLSGLTDSAEEDWVPVVSSDETVPLFVNLDADVVMIPEDDAMIIKLSEGTEESDAGVDRAEEDALEVYDTTMLRHWSAGVESATRELGLRIVPEYLTAAIVGCVGILLLLVRRVSRANVSL